MTFDELSPETVLGLRTDPADLAIVVASAEAAGLSAPLFQEWYGRVACREYCRRGLAEVYFRDPAKSPAETLMRVLIGQMPYPRAEFAAALGEPAAAAWERVGLVAVEGDRVRLRYSLRQYGTCWMAYDRRAAWKGPGDPLVVAAVDRTTMILLALTARRPVGTLLDLGTGNGIQALLAADQAGRVVATDLNPRAVAFARFNAALNGKANVEVRLGDSFRPVADETFDQIVTNPPFAITPDKDFVYRDSGVAGDGFVEQLARTAPARLNEGGLFQMLCQWTQRRGENWQEKLAAWTAESGCDVLVVRERSQSIEDYAFTWNRTPLGEVPDDEGHAYARWVADYERQGIEAISLGLMNFRKRGDGGSSLRFFDAPPVEIPPAGDDILRWFAARPTIAALANDETLAAAKLRIAPGVRLVQVLSAESGAWSVRTGVLQASRGFRHQAELDPLATLFVQSLDGKRAIGHLWNELANRSGLAKLSVRSRLQPQLRDWLDRGLVVPVDAPWLKESFDRPDDPFWRMLAAGGDD